MASVQDIYNEIDRIEGAKGEIAEAIEEKGVAVPEEAKIEEYPGLVRQIRQGSEYAVEYVPQELTPEQQGQARENIGAGTYTKPDDGIPESDLAQGVQESLAKAESAYQKPTGGIPKTDLATAVQNSLGKADTALQPAALTPITDLIPEQATPQNQLADKNFVNSSVATNTANYISDNGQPFQSVADLEAYTGTLTNNDYAFVVGTDAAGNTTYTRFKYNANTGEWAEEYVLNNSSFTAEQWAAISSGITALLVQKLSDLPTEIVTYVAQTLTEAQKQQARTNIGATAPEIFWAEYGVTTASQIDQAIADGKAVMCKYSEHIYRLEDYRTNQPLYFSANVSSQVRYYLLLNRSSNSWSSSSITAELSFYKSQSIETDRESTTKYPSVKAVFDSLFKWGIISQTQTWTGTGTNPRTYTMSGQVWGLIPQANIDLYEANGAVFNANTGYFELNGLTDISYNEMKAIYALTIGAVPISSTRGFQFANLAVRTPLLLMGTSSFATSLQYWFYNSLVEIVKTQNQYCTHANFVGAFRGCARLRRVDGVLSSSSPIVLGTAGALSSSFLQCYSLEHIQIGKLAGNVSFSDSSLLDLESIVYAVNNSANTTAITITLHATAYARCQADTTEYTYNGQTYTGIIAYAAAKSITIASA